MKNTLAGIIFIGLFSCGEIKPQETSAYFSLDSLLHQQQSKLVSKNATLNKIVFASQDSALTSFVPDSLGWANEFQIIEELDINKPALVGRYSISKEKDKNSNLEILRYQAMDNSLEVEYFELYYLKELSDLKLIKAESSESNNIFKSSKSIEIELDHINGDLLLKSYSVKGYQKMILQDSVNFIIQGKIRY